METRRLQYFITVVDAGTITNAAEILHIAQPALSQHIAALENEFKQKLLVRSRKGVEMTSAGRSLYRYARGILHLEQSAHDDIASEQSSPSGSATVAVAPYSHFSMLMIPAVHAIRSRYPNVIVRTVETLSVVHSQAIRLGQVDAGLIYDPGVVRGVHFERIRTEDLCLVTPAEMELPNADDENVPLSTLASLEFIMPRQEHTLRRRLDGALFDIGAELRVAVEIEHTYPLVEAVDAKLGATVLPRTAAEELFGDVNDRATVRRIVEPALPVTLSLATAEDQPLSRAAEVVIEVLREFTIDGQRS